MSIKIKILKKSFGRNVIFDSFSYEFSDTGIYLLKGNSGKGKTTLLRILSGLDKNFEGEISGFKSSDISYCFQEHRLFPTLSVLENVMIASEFESEEDRKKAGELLSYFQLDESTYALLPSQLSGGMKERVALVRSFLKDSKILILDEPSKELDSELINALLDLIKEESGRRLIIISTHDPVFDDLQVKGEIKL